jgi:ABC-type multidrug transport system ATPase subunit
MLEITLDSLSRSFADRPVLTGISAEIQAGERLLVRGPNASGKTTLLKIIAGILSPTEGSVKVREGLQERDPGWQRRWTGYVAPDLALYEEFSAIENLTFFARVRGLSRDPDRDLALLGRLGLGKRADDALGTLSTGLRQRAKLAFAVQADPRILLLDEPGSNLDQAGRDLVEETVTTFSNQETIVIIASNDPSEFGLGTRTFELA